MTDDDETLKPGYFGLGQKRDVRYHHFADRTSGDAS